MKSLISDDVWNINLNPDTLHIYSTRHAYGDDVELEIAHRKGNLALTDLAGKTAFLMVSIKNREFSNRLIDRFCRFAHDHLGKCYITIVDKPYLANIRAFYDDEGDRRREVDKLNEIAKQATSRVTRILSKYPGADISLVPWSELVNRTPAWVKEEVNRAMATDGEFRRDILQRTRQVLTELIEEGETERFCGFLIDEIPVLLYLYYLFDGQVADFYPGENPEFLWKLESGVFAADLPRICEVAETHKGLIYVDFRVTPRPRGMS